MFEFLKKKKPVIVTIHGFGKRVSHEFDPLALYFRQKGYEVIQFDMYDPSDEEDIDYQKWINRAEKKMAEIYKTHKDIVMIGFSMGGVIASYLGTIYPVKRLILTAPAFQYLDLQIVYNYGISAIKNINKKDTGNPSSKFIKAFQALVAEYKDYIKTVTCPVLFLHGTDDEVIPIESSRKAYHSINVPKAMILVEGGKHRMLYDGSVEKTCFAIIEQMINGEIL